MQRVIIQSTEEPSPDWSPLRAVLKRKGIKQGWLAQQVGVSHYLVSLWCRGVRPVDAQYIPAIAKALHVRQGDLR